MDRRILIGCLMVFAAFAVWVIVDALNPFNDRVFDGRGWTHGDIDARIPMAQDVVARVVKIGMARDEVTRILGPPGEVLHGRGSGGKAMPGQETLSYYLGSSGGTMWLGMDDAFVYIHLNDEGFVMDAEISGY